MAYDIIGDIHGEAGKLEILLSVMGYEKSTKGHKHPTRKAIFVGDFIDRGPHQIETLKIVRAMVDEGNALAVMGNHEFNAIAWHTTDPDKTTDFLRTHEGDLGEKNRQQHSAFLGEIGKDEAVHKEWIDWFKTLPLWLELPELRVVHAWWNPIHIQALQPYLKENRALTDEAIVLASREGHPVFEAVEGLCKGMEAALPPDHSFLDEDGHERRNVRVRWWDEEATTYPELALMTPAQSSRLPAVPLLKDLRTPYDQTKPVFFGHYWMKGKHEIQSRRAACVDYSAAKGGPLVAYRWDGESELSAENFVSSS